jgi:segregation and condensation protein A
VRRLLEYEQIREITLRMELSEADRARRFRKGYLPIRPGPAVDELPLETTWEEVFQAAQEVRDPEDADRIHRVVPRAVSMEEKVDLILDRLTRVRRIEFRHLLIPFREKMHGVMTFLAGLELARRRQIHMRQAAPFHELWVYLRDSGAAPGTEEPSPEGGKGANGVGDHGPLRHTEGEPT